jgi:hypothetical protein
MKMKAPFTPETSAKSSTSSRINYLGTRSLYMFISFEWQLTKSMELSTTREATR